AARGRRRRHLILRRRGRFLALRWAFAAENDPALGLGARAALLDPHRIAGLVRIGLVMRGVFLRARDELLVDGMHHAPLDEDRNGLVGLVGYNHAREDTLRHNSISFPQPLRARSPSTVLMRATSRRA